MTMRTCPYVLWVLLMLAGCSSAPRGEPVNAHRPVAFWPQPPALPRIQFVRPFALSSDVAPVQQGGLDRLVFGSETEHAVEINKPYGVSMRDGKIYVCDIRSVCLTVLDLNKRQTRIIGATGLNRLSNPVDVAIADDGVIYVADKSRGVVVFDRNERFANLFTTEQFQPVGIAVSGDRLYICNLGAQNVVVMDRRTGKLIGVPFGTVGDDDGQFRLPLGIAIDPEGNIHVVDLMRCRIQKFSPDGKFLAAVGQMMDTAGNFVRPKHIAIDREGMIYIVDAAFQNVQVFDSEYNLLTSFGGSGDHPGAMSLPAGICIGEIEGVPAHSGLFASEVHPFFAARRFILVTNQFGPNKVGVYALGGLKAGRTLDDLRQSMAPVDSDAREAGDVNPLSGLDEMPNSDPDPQSPPQSLPEDETKPE